MAFAIPTLLQLVTRARNAFRANLPGSDAWLWPNNINPTAKVIGGMMSELFGFADDIQRQKFAITADGDNLDKHGAEINLGRAQPKSSIGPVAITVADAYAVAFGAVFQRSDGTQFSATASVAIATAGTLTVPVSSVETGSDTVTIAGTVLSIASGTTDVNGDAAATAEVGTGGLIGGADVEQDGAYFNPPPGTYRYRILFKKRNPPQGGSPSDYVIWASEVANVTRVYVERLWAGPGTVRIFPMMDEIYANGIPQPSDVANITDFIGALAPAGAAVTVQAPVPVAVNVVVSGLTPSNPQTQSAVQAELAAAFQRLGRVSGNDAGNPSLPFLATPAAFLRIWINQAVANATGVTGGAVTAPTVDTGLSAGQVPVLGTITFD